VQSDGIIRQNDETAKNLLKNHLKYDTIIMGRGERAKNPPPKIKTKRGTKNDNQRNQKQN
jgi:hypothetical protein